MRRERLSQGTIMLLGIAIALLGGNFLVTIAFGLNPSVDDEVSSILLANYRADPRDAQKFEPIEPELIVEVINAELEDTEEASREAENRLEGTPAPTRTPTSQDGSVATAPPAQRTVSATSLPATSAPAASLTSTLAPTQPPSATSVPPSATDQPATRTRTSTTRPATARPLPTDPPTRVPTRVPTAVPTDVPTNTPEPAPTDTNTPEPAPTGTNTPEPAPTDTNTPEPPPTERPTDRPPPTDPPRPPTDPPYPGL